jgi:YVTN family beta-propeller protein
MIHSRLTVVLIAVLLLLNARSWAGEDVHVGPVADGAGGTIVTTKQLIRPAGESIEYKGRPVDLALSPDGRTAYVLSNGQLLIVDAAAWKIRRELKYPEKTHGSMHGIVVSSDGSRIYACSSDSRLLEAQATADGNLTWTRQIRVGKEGSKRDSYPCGVALLPPNRALVALSMNNSVAIVDLDQGSMSDEMPVGVAPYDVAIDPAGKIAYVSNWGGRRPREGDKTAESAGTKTVVDDRGTASTGTIGVIDLESKKQIAEIAVGLHPSDLLLAADGKTLYCANANSDTVSIIDTATRAVTDTLTVRPDEKLPFGSISNALAIANEKLFVANGGNNAIGVVDLKTKTIAGFIPAGWFPSGVDSDGKNLFIANVKGTGSRTLNPQGKLNSHGYSGTITKCAIPSSDAELKKLTEQVRADSLVPQTLRALEKAQSDVKPVPVPQRAGEPSVFEHVVYVIKENRTYDQVFGDMPRGNNDPKLCVFGRAVTPNHHALAEQFALLDNFYCNGVCSADGHAWVTEGLTVDYLEKSLGDFVRSYPFEGDDALAIAPTGFIWDNVLLHGLSFRNYGEMFMTHPQPGSTWTSIYQDWKNKTGRMKFEHLTMIDTLRKYSCPDSPGWNMRISDQIRADVFIRELEQAEKTGQQWPNLVTLYLPIDHTNGINPGTPTPAAMVADNDLALGRCVEAISKSKFWPKTCIFVIEDDPQSGFDHVDGHRSICLAISPYTKRGQTISAFYNQTSVLHTLELMLGLPPMNQLDAMAPVMRECFTEKADLRPYECLPNQTPLDQMNPPKAALRGEQLKLAQKSERLNFDEPDRADEDTLNRIVWHAVKGYRSPYPDAWAGPHGRGLRKLHLKLDRNVVDDD